MDKTKTYQTLLKAHDTLYAALEILEDMRPKDVESMATLVAVLETMDQAEALLNKAVESPHWTRKGE